jgi:transposase InsO family protein
MAAIRMPWTPRFLNSLKARAGRLIPKSSTDRGSPMFALTFSEQLQDLGITKSFSRPRVSNDNPFGESQFKTTKYWPSYPGKFLDLTDARSWCSEFFPAYNQRPPVVVPSTALVT